MTKRPEEGDIWEWRAFGHVSQALKDRLAKLPVRHGILDHPDEDIYLISAVSEHNIKLRKVEGRWVLKFKLLLRSLAGPACQESGAPLYLEQYRESAAMTYQVPVDHERLQETARWLGVRLPDRAAAPDSSSQPARVLSANPKQDRPSDGFPGESSHDPSAQTRGYDIADLIDCFSSATPEIKAVSVPKTRSQFILEGAWAEVAKARFPYQTTETLAFLSYERTQVERAILGFCSDLRERSDLAELNYVQACRKWGLSQQ